jgi:hypothetical protein
MAEPDSRRTIHVQLECRNDRYSLQKLAQVYRILVPGNEPSSQIAQPLSHETQRSHLRQSFLGSAERTKHDCQLDSAAAGVCHNS